MFSVTLFLLFLVLCQAHYPGPSSATGSSPDYAADSHYAYYQETYSFFPPFPFENYFIVKNWDYGGSAIIFEDHCRLTPDVANKRGWMWSQQPVDLERWEAIFALKIGGKGKIYGDGMAFWWTKNRMKSGPIFGNEDHWEGLGVFIDTYDNNNDNKHPYLSAFWNDGTTSWDHDNDGGEYAKIGCKIKPLFRNKGAIQVVVSYFIEKIQILIFDESTEKWYDCLNMTLEKKFDTSMQYFGFSASTGAVSDFHDILSFEVYDMKKMAQEGGHEHVDPSRFSSFDDPSFLWTIFTYFSYLIGFIAIIAIVYVGILFYRAKKDRKRGMII